LNTTQPYFPRTFSNKSPCTTAPDFLKAVIEACFRAGAGKVVVGERGAFHSSSTRNIAKELGLDKAVTKTGAEIVFFDEGKWFSVDVNQKYVKQITLPEAAWEHDVLINLPCLKTHKLARFTQSLKNTIGMIHPMEMPTLMFLGNLEYKIAEINTVVWPDLVIMDARKCFITNGPATGEVARPGFILASGDRVANDVVGLRILKNYNAVNRLKYDAPFDYIQIKHAGEIGVGVKKESQIKVV